MQSAANQNRKKNWWLKIVHSKVECIQANPIFNQRILLKSWKIVQHFYCKIVTIAWISRAKLFCWRPNICIATLLPFDWGKRTLNHRLWNWIARNIFHSTVLSAIESTKKLLNFVCVCWFFLISNRWVDKRRFSIWNISVSSSVVNV